MGDILESVNVLDASGELRTRAAGELDLEYRSSVFRRSASGGTNSDTLLSAELNLCQGDRDQLEQCAEDLLLQRRATQPRAPSAGSVFRNPEGDFAGRLLEAVGLKGTCRGGAQISRRHANFIVNRGGANAQDVVDLMEMACERVLSRFGICLEPEIILVGEWPPSPA
jgi:UDP-N-acetylmuramate dehydrogenase